MNFKKYLKYTIGAIAFTLASCQDYLDINRDPTLIVDAPIEQVFTAATSEVSFLAASDLHRFSALLTQQLSGQSQGATVQTQEYERYNISGSDLNNLWGNAYATCLSDLELVILKADKEKSPAYGGCAKILKAYMFHLLADTWGKIPYSESLKFTDNTSPKYDDAATIYPSLIALLDEAIVNINATSVKAPATNSFVYTGAWAASKPRWERLANTLKLRLWIHYSKVDKAKAVAEIAKIAPSSTMQTMADNFQMAFFNVSRQQNPTHQFELDRANYLFANATLVDMMNAKNDPRRARYFTAFPLHSGQFKGAKGGDATSQRYSRIHIYLRGDTVNTAAAQTDGSIAYNAYNYTGTAPVRMMTIAEMHFIRAEAAVLGGANISGIAADSFFRMGIRASMLQAGVSTAMIEAYVSANGSLTGSDTDKIKQIIEEKYIANFGVVMEPWTDWRRTAVPNLKVPVNAIVPNVPRSLFYAQSEIDLNTNAPKQKAPDLQERVFWDK